MVCFQEPFDHVSSKFRQKMNDGMCQELIKTLRKLNIEAFLSELVEIIMLELQQWDETPAMEEYELVTTAL